jgi:hypothetical protein
MHDFCASGKFAHRCGAGRRICRQIESGQMHADQELIFMIAFRHFIEHMTVHSAPRRNILQRARIAGDDSQLVAFSEVADRFSRSNNR